MREAFALQKLLTFFSTKNIGGPWCFSYFFTKILLVLIRTIFVSNEYKLCLMSTSQNIHVMEKFEKNLKECPARLELMLFTVNGDSAAVFLDHRPRHHHHHHHHQRYLPYFS